MSQSQAFDPLAPTYDDHFTNTTIGQYLRGLVQERLAAHFSAGDHVLELGCGTGEDALWLAERGVRVVATDVSEGMLAAARAKCAGNELVRVERLDLKKLSVKKLNHRDTETRQREHELSEVSEGEQFDGVFSNFGPMNCLSEWRTVAGWLAARVKTGGIVGLGVMSPLCLWEPLWHGLHADFKVATRRWRKSVVFQPRIKPNTTQSDENWNRQDAKRRHLNHRDTENTETGGRVGLFSGEPITVTYPTIRGITQQFEPHFRRVYVRGLGVFLPPSDVYGVIEKRPRLLKLLMGLERRWGAYGKLALLADHYWVEFERV